MQPDYATPSELRLVQEENLLLALDWAWQTPFYQQHFERHGVSRDAVRSLEDVWRLPLTTKLDLRSTLPTFRSALPRKDVEYVFSSSGTTGAPTHYLWSRTDTEVMRQGGSRAMGRVGVAPEDCALIIAPMGLPVMWFCMINQYNAMHSGVVPLGASSPGQTLDAIVEFQPTIITSLPIVGTRLAEYAAMTGRSAALAGRRCFHCAGDYLSNARRRRIESVWGDRCYNFFGLSEIFGPVAGECKCRDGMHVMSDRVLIEVLDPRTLQPAGEGEVGIAVFTALWQKGSPLIRYQSEDYVRLVSAPCRCGRTSPRLYYAGRSPFMANIGGHLVFPQRVEEVLLGLPSVGNEFRLTVVDDDHTDAVIVELEPLPGQRVDVAALSQALSDVLSAHVRLLVREPGTLARDEVKPHRIYDERSRRC
ncbi:MAG TPA: AMP-binding protein [Anaerolineae bacterium]|nr:AMP-binding protein [Anaerolineae bacterium]HPL28227.1 AMP-binding protein [Anaerolineae bacterium]